MYTLVEESILPSKSPTDGVLRRGPAEPDCTKPSVPGFMQSNSPNIIRRSIIHKLDPCRNYFLITLRLECWRKMKGN